MHAIFPTLLKKALSPPTTSDIFLESSSLETHSSDDHEAAPLPNSVQSEAPIQTSPIHLGKISSIPSPGLSCLSCFT